jgi:hypothetical protein
MTKGAPVTIPTSKAKAVPTRGEENDVPRNGMEPNSAPEFVGFDEDCRDELDVTELAGGPLFELTL